MQLRRPLLRVSYLRFTEHEKVLESHMKRYRLAFNNSNDDSLFVYGIK